MTKDELLRQLEESLGDDVEALALIVAAVELLAKRRLERTRAA